MKVIVHSYEPWQMFQPFVLHGRIEGTDTDVIVSLPYDPETGYVEHRHGIAVQLDEDPTHEMTIDARPEWVKEYGF